MIPNDHKVLDEKERIDLDDTVAILELETANGKKITHPEGLLVRAYEHIQVLDERILNFSKHFQILDTAHERLSGVLDKLAELHRRHDLGPEAYELLHSEGYIE